jgi:hypothetical protein
LYVKIVFAPEADQSTCFVTPLGSVGSEPCICETHFVDGKFDEKIDRNKKKRAVERRF